MRKNVYLDPRCLSTSIIPSVLEEYHKEVSGYLIGSNGRKASRLRIVSAYPMQTNRKNPTWVAPGNFSAEKRVDGVMQVLKMSLVGGYHTHPDGPHRLSKSDVEFVREQMDKRSLSSWFELIVSVKRKEYQTPHKAGWKLKNLDNKISMLIKPTPLTGFDVTLSGYWILPEGGPREARLWSSSRQNF